jgi:hypothetical protein
VPNGPRAPAGEVAAPPHRGPSGHADPSAARRLVGIQEVNSEQVPVACLAGALFCCIPTAQGQQATDKREEAGS